MTHQAPEILSALSWERGILPASFAPRSEPRAPLPGCLSISLWRAARDRALATDQRQEVLGSDQGGSRANRFDLIDTEPHLTQDRVRIVSGTGTAARANGGAGRARNRQQGFVASYGATVSASRPVARGTATSMVGVRTSVIQTMPSLCIIYTVSFLSMTSSTEFA